MEKNNNQKIETGLPDIDLAEDIITNAIASAYNKTIAAFLTKLDDFSNIHQTGEFFIADAKFKESSGDKTDTTVIISGKGVIAVDKEDFDRFGISKDILYMLDEPDLDAFCWLVSDYYKDEL